MSPLTVILAALLAGIGLGYGANYGQISLLNDAIDKSNADAKRQLEASTREVKAAEYAAEQFNNDLDKSREQFIKTAYAYDGKLDNINRLFRNSRKGCGSASAASNPSEVYGDPTASPTIEEEAVRIIMDEIPIAEDAYNYAVEARAFALNKCGIIGPE